MEPGFVESLGQGISEHVGFPQRNGGKAVAETGLFIGWGDMVDGREKRALELFDKSLH